MAAIHTVRAEHVAPFLGRRFTRSDQDELGNDCSEHITGWVAEQGLRVTMAKAVDGELVAMGSAQKRQVGRRPGPKAAHATVSQTGGGDELAQPLGEGLGAVAGRECFGMAVMGGLRNLGQAGQIRDTLAQGQSWLGTAVFSGVASAVAELGRIRLMLLRQLLTANS
ncbi:hypothetical protein ACFL5O_02410 [Myxococcota bacterium]